MNIPEFVRISDSAHVFERDIDPLCAMPSMSFHPDETLYARVVETDAPAFDTITQRCLRTGVEYVNGAWQYKWTVEDLDEADVAANQAANAQRIQSEIVAATQKRLDDFARTRNYDGILSLCTYATSAAPKFQTEGQYGVTCRDATWAALYQVMAEVEAGNLPMPTGYADIEPDLPELVWPTAAA